MVPVFESGGNEEAEVGLALRDPSIKYLKLYMQSESFIVGSCHAEACKQ